ncbi:MAG TPA: BON domain-containing protein [Blastocatellia bacterium]|nr:BON domain-containing protein [Blastocatellia bacterium]
MVPLDSDIRIQQAVLQELRWNTQIGGTKIGVAVEQGVVTLLGVVDSFTERWFAQEAAHGIPGVRGVANDLRIKMGERWLTTNTEIARAARQAIDLRLPGSGKHLSITVSKGWVTLEGGVDSMQEREEAEEAVCRIRGVRGVKNRIAIILSEACRALQEA